MGHQRIANGQETDVPTNQAKQQFTMLCQLLPSCEQTNLGVGLLSTYAGILEDFKKLARFSHDAE
eukprot:1160063-Pelagomonas_calceolata.AAC.1